MGPVRLTGFASQYMADPARVVMDADTRDRALLVPYPAASNYWPGGVGNNERFERTGPNLVRVRLWERSLSLKSSDMRTETLEGSLVKLNTQHVTRSKVAQPKCAGRWENFAFLRYQKKTYSGYLIESLMKDGPLVVHLSLDADKRLRRLCLCSTIEEAIRRHMTETYPALDEHTAAEPVDDVYKKLCDLTGDAPRAKMTLSELCRLVPAMHCVSLPMLADCGMLGSVDDVEWTHADSPKLLTLLAGFQCKLKVVKPVDMLELSREMDSVREIEPGLSEDGLRQRSAHDTAYKDDRSEWMCLCRLSTRSIERDVVMDRYTRGARKHPELMPL